ncbi:Tetracycline resistance protein, class B [Sinobacterium norvegicum]|uniref:Tetracycline resistance protein, class B n=1 Tax=Sinobacterium norvegicum TaxID=1641715 RepID=A0ABM9ABH0_9GAMM|nr:MFS transporter [Sinobacterium norvegicum]CAH0990543.1 Tetracycline resistance protein, class B [Sinobacterium norvegicum]
MSNSFPEAAPLADQMPSGRLNLLLLATFAMGMGQTVVFAIIPMLGRELFAAEHWQITFGAWQYNPPPELLVNTLIATSSLTYFLVTPFWGRRSDVIGRKKVILIGLLGYSFGMLLFNAVVHMAYAAILSGWLMLAVLLLSRAAHSLVMSGTFPASMAYMADCTTPATRTRGVSRLSAANGIGIMVGPALAWFATISFLAPLYIQAVITASVALVIALYLPQSPQPNLGRKTSKLQFSDPRFAIYLFLGLSMFTMMGMVQQTLGYYFQDRLGLTSVEAAKYFSIGMMCSSGAMLVAQLIVVQRWRGRPQGLLMLGLPVAAIGYLMLVFSVDFQLLAVAMAVFGFGMGLAAPGYNASATLTVEAHEQGALAGLLSAAPGLGYVVGPLLGGWLYSVDVTFPYWAAAIVVVILGVFSILRFRR